MNSVHLVVFGDPKPQKRHRHTSKGRFVRTYDPSSKDKNDLLWVVQNRAPEKPMEGPLSVHIYCYFTRPKSHYRTGRNSGILKDGLSDLHTTRPDPDNLAKLVLDALNGVFFKDDSQICDLFVKKRYDEQPRTEIWITPM